jgi:hypothetical protein
MANNLRAWSTTAASNGTADADINAAEGCPPSAVNDDIRQMMAKTKNTLQDAEWFDWGHTATYVSATSFATPGDLSAVYAARRRLKFGDSTTLYGTVVSSSYIATNTTVTVVLDTGSLSASLATVAPSIQTPANTSAPANFNKDEVATTGGTSTAFTLTLSPPLPSLFTNATIGVKFHTTCGAAPTLAVSGLTAKQITKSGGTNLSAGDVVTNQESLLRYNGTSWEVIAGASGTPGITWTRVTADPANASARTGYIADTSGGAFTITLPSSPTAGDEIAFTDGTGTWDTANLTVARNGATIMGSASDLICNIKHAAFRLVYNGTAGDWRFA